MKRITQLRLARIGIASALAIGTIGAAQAQSYLDVDFNAPRTIAGDSVKFKGSFTYNNVVYGPSTAIASGGVTAPTANSINLSAFSADTLHNAANPKLGNNNTYQYDDGTPGGNVVYRVYRQQYSGVVANLTKGTLNEQEERKHFVKAVVGQGSSLAALDTLPNDSYTYNGIAFSNFPTGNFSYTVDLTAKKGQGTFTLDNILVPASWVGGTGDARRLDVAGTLNQADIIANANGIVGSGVAGGGVTAGAANSSDSAQVALWNAIVSNSTDTPDPKYYLNFFGTNSGADVAKEVAGTIVGLPERIGGVAIIGKR